MDHEDKYIKYKAKYLKLKDVNQTNINLISGGKKSNKSNNVQNLIKIIFVKHGESTQNISDSFK